MNNANVDDDGSDDIDDAIDGNAVSEVTFVALLLMTMFSMMMDNADHINFSTPL